MTRAAPLFSAETDHDFVRWSCFRTGIRQEDEVIPGHRFPCFAFEHFDRSEAPGQQQDQRPAARQDPADGPPSRSSAAWPVARGLSSTPAENPRKSSPLPDVWPQARRPPCSTRHPASLISRQSPCIPRPGRKAPGTITIQADIESCGQCISASGGAKRMFCPHEPAFLPQATSIAAVDRDAVSNGTRSSGARPAPDRRAGFPVAANSGSHPEF